MNPSLTSSVISTKSLIKSGFYLRSVTVITLAIVVALSLPRTADALTPLQMA